MGASEQTQSPVVLERNYIICTSSGRSSSIPSCQKKEVTLSVLSVGAREAAEFTEVTLSVIAVGAREAAHTPVVKRKNLHYLY